MGGIEPKVIKLGRKETKIIFRKGLPYFGPRLEVSTLAIA